MARRAIGWSTRAVASVLSFVIVATFGWLCVATNASAQIAPPPMRTYTDANGVDLASGVLRTSMTPISVGQPDSGGLAYIRSFDSSAQAWRDNLTGGIDSSGTTYTVTLFGVSRTFTLSGGVFTPTEADGATLTYASGTDVYTYTTRTGAVASYSGALAGSSPTQANEGRITTYTEPSGLITTFTYTVITPATSQRLQSVTNNLGYQIAFEYDATTPTTLLEVTALNNAVDYCDPTANSCTFSQTWPSLTFNAASPTTVTDALGRVTRYTYTSGRITGIRRPSSSTTDHLTITYTSGLVSAVSNGTGTWTYTYTQQPINGYFLAFIEDPLGHTRRLRTHFVTRQIMEDRDALGRTVTYAYDGSNRLDRITQPEGNYVELDYDSRGNVITTTQVAKSGSGLSNIVSTAVYAATCANAVTCNLPTSVTDPRGFRTDLTYDSTHGGILTATSPAPSGSAPVGSGVRPQTRVAYTQLYAYYKNSAGVIVQAPSAIYVPTTTSACATTSNCASGGSAADETRTIITYGATGVANNLLPTRVTTQDGTGTLSTFADYAYDGVGNQTQVEGPLSGADVTVTRYDAMRQVIGIVGPDPDAGGALKHRARRFTYNADGQMTIVEAGTVNSQSNPDWAAFASLEQIDVVYDFIGRRVRTSFVTSGATRAVSQLSYDNANRLECSTVRMNPAIFGSLPSSACTLGTQGTNGPDRVTRQSYNDADQVTQVTSGYGTASPINEATVTYTSNALQQTLADGRGNLTTFVYDGFDRLDRMRYPDASNGSSSSTTDYEQYNYDAASNVTAVRRRDGQNIAMLYDNLSRLTLNDPPGSSDDVAYAYDNFSRTLSIGSLTFAYDQLSRVTSATAAQGTVSYAYDAAGRRTRMDWPDSFYVTYDYDLTNAVTAIRENGAASGVGVLATFAYNNLGRRVLLTRGNGVSTTYVYDSASRLDTLTQDLANTGQDQTYGFSYNDAGQIIERTGSNSVYNTPPPYNAAIDYARNGLNQYTQAGSPGPTYGYDARGNLTSAAANIYGYDVFNRLISTSAATLAYDAAGRLRETVGGGMTTRFLYDGSALIAEYDASNALQRRYVHGVGIAEPLVWYEGVGTSDRRWLVADQLGSVVAVTNVSGAATSINAYDEYGVPSSTNIGRFQYGGQSWLADAGLYDFRARAYSPELGRFVQEDPIGFGGGMNFYSYVLNDPVNYIDPHGLCYVEGEAVRECPPCRPGRICLTSAPSIIAFLEALDRVNRLTDPGIDDSGRKATESLQELANDIDEATQCSAFMLGVSGNGAAGFGGMAGGGVIVDRARGRAGVYWQYGPATGGGANRQVDVAVLPSQNVQGVSGGYSVPLAKFASFTVSGALNYSPPSGDVPGAFYGSAHLSQGAGNVQTAPSTSTATIPYGEPNPNCPTGASQ